MKIEPDIKLDYGDVLIRPKKSILNSRSEVNLIRNFKFNQSNFEWKGIPIIASNMDTIGTIKMLNIFYKNKMLTCLHKYININNLITYFSTISNDIEHPNNYYALSTGISDNDYNNLVENISKLEKNNFKTNFICVDVANGYMLKLVHFCKKLSNKYPNKVIIAGNVVSPEIVEELIINGKVDIVKVGIGSGSVCTTRLQTGVGMPQLSAVLECADAAHGLNGYIISDGGARVPGDLSKAFGAGSDFVMAGSIFSGHDESAGEIVTIKDKKWKIFYGMSSKTAMNKYHGGVANYRSSEGKTVKVQYKGPVQNTIYNILGGIRSTCTYIGAKRIKDLSKCTTFVRVNNQVNNIYSNNMNKIYFR